MANFLSKPSASLGPMVGFALLSHIATASTTGTATEPAAELSSSGFGGFSGLGGGGLGGGGGGGGTHVLGVLCLVLGLPLVVVGCQRLLWRRFTLRGGRLAAVKAFLTASQEACAV